MNMVFCDGVMPPEMNWETREYYDGNWKYWLQFIVEKNHDVLMQIPKFPHAHALLMKYPEWERIMNMQDINENTVLVGHSAGAGFILKYMAKHSYIRPAQVVLVAPWIDTTSEQPFGFYDGFKLDDDLVNRTTNGIDILYSTDDMPIILQSIAKIKSDVPSVKFHEFENRGHFIAHELPEILDIIKF